MFISNCIVNPVAWSGEEDEAALVGNKDMKVPTNLLDRNLVDVLGHTQILDRNGTVSVSNPALSANFIRTISCRP